MTYTLLAFLYAAYETGPPSDGGTPAETKEKGATCSLVSLDPIDFDHTAWMRSPIVFTIFPIVGCHPIAQEEGYEKAGPCICSGGPGRCCKYVSIMWHVKGRI